MTVKEIITRQNLYYFGLALMIVSLPLSKYLMSVAQFILVINWLFDPKVLDKFRVFFSNKAALIIVSLYLLHIIGMLWTSDFNYGFKDLRTKLPILALPVVIASSPALSRRHFHFLIILFIAANVLGSMFSLHELLTTKVIEIRKISLFISHIRFSLNICIAIFSGLFLVFTHKEYPVAARIILAASVVWLIIFLVLMEAITGLVVMIITLLLVLFFVVLWSENRFLKVTLLTVMIMVPLLLFLYVRQIYRGILPKEEMNVARLEKVSRFGNPYFHDTTNKMLENGHWVGLYIQEDELREAWNRNSSYAYDGKDSLGQYIKNTLWRFLTSKNLRKDADGFSKLTSEEIHAVESGIATPDQMSKTSIRTRIKTILWEMQVYRNTGYLSHHSVMQRLEFWRAAVRIINKNWFFGTGTGDIEKAFSQEYEEMKTQLDKEVRWRSHNQYLSVWATLGLPGLLWFLFVLVVPGFVRRMNGDYFYFTFLCILMLSMLTEDTIESQAGVTFYAFFVSFFLLARDTPERFFNTKQINIRT